MEMSIHGEVELSETSRPEHVGIESSTTPRKTILADFNRLIAEVDASELVQKELRRTEPQLASASSFLNIVSGGTSKDKNKLLTDEALDRPAYVPTDVSSVVDASRAADVALEGQSQRESKYAERMRVTRITAAVLFKRQLEENKPLECVNSCFS